MPNIIYSGSVSEATGLNQAPLISLSSSGGTAEGIINSVTARLTFSTNAYSNYYNVSVTLHYDGGSVSTTSTVKMDASNYTKGQFDFAFTGLTVGQVNSIESLSVSCSENASKIYLKESQSVTVDYLPVSETDAPTVLSLSAESAAPGAKITLSWSDASAGENNPIVGYNVYRSTSADGSYSLLASVSASDTTGSVVVTAPTSNGSSYYYKVSTLGTYDGYDSEKSVEYATLTCSFASVGAPTTVKLSATNAAPGAELTLSWSGASSGDNNSIVGYEVYRADSAAGEYSLLATVESTSTSGSTTVTAPTTNNASYYYKVLTVGSLDGYNSDLSGVYATLTCTYSTPGAPTKVTVNGGDYVYASPGADVTLSWSGASSGANNAILGYRILCNDETLVTVHDARVASATVRADTNVGGQRGFAVVAIGAYSNSAPTPVRWVYTYSDPVAPTMVTVSNDTPAAGARVTLSWSGAKAGGFNDIVGYRVYRSRMQNGATTQVAQLSVSTNHASCYVTAPANIGGVYYYWVETIGSYTTSGLSAVYATVTASKEQEDTGGDTTVVVPKPRGYQKRGFVFGDYDTAANGWTLTNWEFLEPEAQTNYVDVPGRSVGPLDYSTVLTDGDPRYGSRELTALFELSEWTRQVRNDVISEMVNQLHGMHMEIVFPDDNTRYAVGRLSVNKNYSDMAHAEVSIQAVCEPWLYNQQETQVTVMATEGVNTLVLSNGGRRILVPDVTVSGTKASVHLTCGENSWTLGEGSYRLPDLELRTGNTFVTYSGYGTLTFKYREAII